MRDKNWHDAPKKSRFANERGERYGKFSRPIWIMDGKVSEPWRGSGGILNLRVTFCLIYLWFSCFFFLLRYRDRVIQWCYVWVVLVKGGGKTPFSSLLFPSLSSRPFHPLLSFPIVVGLGRSPAVNAFAAFYVLKFDTKIELWHRRIVSGEATRRNTRTRSRNGVSDRFPLWPLLNVTAHERSISAYLDRLQNTAKVNKTEQIIPMSYSRDCRAYVGLWSFRLSCVLHCLRHADLRM